MIYLFLLIVFSIPVFFKDKLSFYEKPYWYWGECFLLILVAGLRLVVGGDTQTYLADFDVYPPLEDFTILHFALFRYQPLWTLLNCVAKSIYPQFFVVQIIVSCIINPVTFYIIKKETEKKYEVALVFLLFQFLYLNCEIMRETIAISMFYFAFSFYIKRRWLPYYGICAVCFFFHDAAIFYFFLPLLYPILTREFTAKYVIVMATFILVFANPLVLSKLMFFLPESRVEVFTDFYAKMAIGSIFGILRSITELIFAYFIIVKVKGIVSYKVYIGLKIYFLMHLIGLMMPLFVNRICNSYNLFYYIALVEFLYLMRNKLVTVAYVGLLTIVFARYYFVDVTNLVSSKESSDKYYFYELFVPYYSIFETPDANVVARRRAIYLNQVGDNNN